MRGELDTSLCLENDPLDNMPVTSLMGELYATREEFAFIEHLGYASLFAKTLSFSFQSILVQCIKEFMIVAWGVNSLFQ